MPTQAELRALWESAAPTQPSQDELRALWESAAPMQEQPTQEQAVQQGMAQQTAPIPADVPFGNIGEFVGEAAPQPERTLGEQAIGVGETALSALTGATAGTLGGIKEFGKGLYEGIVSGQIGSEEFANELERKVMEGLQSGTYAPRTAAGQEISQQVGELAAPLQAAGPMAEFAALGSRATLPVKGGVGKAVAEAVAEPLQAIGETPVAAVRAPVTAVSKAIGKIRKAPETEGAIGADVVSQAALRQLQADELPIQIRLTKGQRERGQPQTQFEQEIAKQEVGQPLRDRFKEQNLQIQQNLDAFIDQTGTEAFSLRDIGYSIDDALGTKMKIDKARINRAYDAARNAGELEGDVQLPGLIDHLNETLPEAEVAPILKTVRQKAIRLGAAIEDEQGNLVPGDISLNNAELLRRSIGDATDANPVNIRQAAKTKGLIDSDTLDKGGNLYKKARSLRAEYGQNYEDIGLIKRLTSTKRGSDDRVVAVENTLNEIMRSPVDSVVHMRRILKKAGPKGEQGWRDIQGGILQNIRDKALKNMQRDENGNPIPSPAAIHKAINDLDATGKLEAIFTKKGAEQLRTLDEVAQNLYTFPPGSVNFSNTSSALINALDHVGGLAALGVPVKVPILTGLAKLGQILKGRKVRKRIKEALK